MGAVKHSVAAGSRDNQKEMMRPRHSGGLPERTAACGDGGDGCTAGARRLQRVEAANARGDQRALPEAPIRVADSFEEHVHILMGLIAVAFQSDTTRAFSFKLGRDASGRSYPESGVTTGFHNASHHGEREDRILEFAKINRYPVSMLPYLMEKLKNTPEGDSTMLGTSLVI